MLNVGREILIAVREINIVGREVFNFCRELFMHVFCEKLDVFRNNLDACFPRDQKCSPGDVKYLLRLLRFFRSIINNKIHLHIIFFCGTFKINSKFLCIPESGTGWPPPGGCRPSGPARTACCPSQEPW